MDPGNLGFQGWGGGQSQVQYIQATSHQGPCDQTTDHFPRNPSIPAYHDASPSIVAQNIFRVGGTEFDQVNGG